MNDKTLVASPDWLMDWDEDDDGQPTDPAVIAALGFDPALLAGEAPAQPRKTKRRGIAQVLLAADADWDEDKHKRGQPGNAGQFGPGGGAAHANLLPSPPPAQGGAAKKVHAEAHKGLSAGDHPTELGDKVKALAANYSHPYLASYASKLLMHIEKAHGLKPGSLGKAVPKPPGAAKGQNSPGAPIKKAAPGTSPAEPPTPAPVKKLNPVGPKPHPDSANQNKIWAMADAPGSPEAKIKDIKTFMGTLPSGSLHSENFANEWITALGGDPGDIGKTPTAAPTPSDLGTGQSHTAVIKGAPARVNKAVKLEQAAKKITTTNSAEALTVAPSLGAGYWANISSAVKQSVKGYGDGEYDDINNALRGDSPTALKKAAAEAIENIDSLFDHDEAISTEAVVLRRGENTPQQLLDQWRAALKDGWPPCIYTRTGYTSASMAHEPAFASKKVWFHFTAPKGTRMVGLAGHVGHYENEMLLQHGQSMEIYEISESGGKTHVKATLK